MMARMAVVAVLASLTFGCADRFSAFDTTPFEWFDHQGRTYGIRDAPEGGSLLIYKPQFGTTSDRAIFDAAALFIAQRHPGCTIANQSLWSGDGTILEVGYRCAA